MVTKYNLIVKRLDASQFSYLLTHNGCTRPNLTVHTRDIINCRPVKDIWCCRKWLRDEINYPFTRWDTHTRTIHRWSAGAWTRGRGSWSVGGWGGRIGRRQHPPKRERALRGWEGHAEKSLHIRRHFPPASLHRHIYGIGTVQGGKYFKLV